MLKRVKEFLSLCLTACLDARHGGGNVTAFTGRGVCCVRGSKGRVAQYVDPGGAQWRNGAQAKSARGDWAVGRRRRGMVLPVRMSPPFCSMRSRNFQLK